MSDGEHGKREGMRRAQQHADPHWWQCMLEAGKAVAEEKPYFNADDLLLWMRCAAFRGDKTMTIGDRVRLAGPDNIDGTVIPTPAFGVGTWVRWDAGEVGEADPASLEKIGEETSRRKRRWD